MSSEASSNKVMNFKDFKQIKFVDNIKNKYKIGKILGEG